MRQHARFLLALSHVQSHSVEDLGECCGSASFTVFALERVTRPISGALLMSVFGDG